MNDPLVLALLTIIDIGLSGLALIVYGWIAFVAFSALYRMARSYRNRTR